MLHHQTIPRFKIFWLRKIQIVGCVSNLTSQSPHLVSPCIGFCVQDIWVDHLLTVCPLAGITSLGPETGLIGKTAGLCSIFVDGGVRLGRVTSLTIVRWFVSSQLGWALLKDVKSSLLLRYLSSLLLNTSIDVSVVFLMFFGRLLNSLAPMHFMVCFFACSRWEGVLLRFCDLQVLPLLWVKSVLVCMLHSSVLARFGVRFSNIFQMWMMMYRSLLLSSE